MTIAAPSKEVAPPGWEDTVKKMKSHPEIDNPWALAWWMADKGESTKEDGVDPGLALIQKWEDFEKSPEYQAYMGEHPPVSESKRVSLSFGTRFLEAGGKIDDAKREVPVLIIKEGMGNNADRHFYSADLLKKVAPLFDGIKAYANHPSKTEETDRPERDVREIVGYYQAPHIIEVDGKTAIAATLKIIDGSAYDWAWNLVKEAASFAKKFKDKDLVGVSINAWGASHQVETEDGGVLNIVDDLTEVQSADIVTQAGAGGGFRLRESVKKALTREAKTLEGKDMKDALLKHAEGMKALQAEMAKNPDHAKTYGPAMEEMMKNLEEMMKGAEAEAEAGAVPPPAPEPEPDADDKKEAARKAAGDETFEQMTERYKAGKMSKTEVRLFEELSQVRAEVKVKENVAMIEKIIREAGIPEAYADDLPVLCAGKPESDVKRLVESRKKLVTPLIGDRGQGAGAGNGGSKNNSKIGEKLAASGVKMVASK